MELEGKIIDVLTPETGTSARGEWKKQPFILEQNGKFPRKACLIVWGNKFDPNLYLNKAVTISIDLESREFKGRWYTDVTAWDIKLRGGNEKTAFEVNEPPMESDINQENDDLPF